jgi:hypothetical protein
LSGKNDPSQHIQLTKNEFTHYDAQEEVLLSPFFTFQVVEVTEDRYRNEKMLKKEDGTDETIKCKTTTVTLVEIPYQHSLRKR